MSDITLEVYEGGCGIHKIGDKLKYPEDRGKICPWLWDSARVMVRVLQYGGTLPWKYSNTPYAKEIDPYGITTEFIRCPDPTSKGIVLKVTLKATEDKSGLVDLDKVLALNRKSKK
ncbi:MAG: hypothetical protein ACXAD7_13315 [Candidatus Kariarchaeaceae archaeon]|jgi:uncharacterized repeat protein (TIGR04076 family)